MNIETKYDIGDTVVMLHGQQIIAVNIERITVTVTPNSQYGNMPVVVYRVREVLERHILRA